MKHKRRVDAFLDNTQTSEHYYLAADSFNAITRDVPGIFTALLFRRRANRLLDSRHTDDIQAVREINRAFQYNDLGYLAAVQASSDMFNDPIMDNSETPGIIQWLAKSSRHDMSTFCKWNIERTHDLQSAIDRDKPEIINGVMERTQTLTNIGLFPSFAPRIMENATERYNLVAMDTFLSAGYNRIGFCTDREIVMANMYNDRLSLAGESTELNRISFHEYLHGAGSDRGFFGGIYTPMEPLRPIEEAFVEHATVVALTDAPQQPSLIDPEERADILKNKGGYWKERTLLNAIIKNTGISVEQMGEAYFTPMHTERGDRIRADIEYKIGKFFLSDERFFNFIEKYEQSKRTGRDDLILNTLETLQSDSNTMPEEI